MASQEEALYTGKARGTPGSCHDSQSPPDLSVHSRETSFPCTGSTFKPRIESHHGGIRKGQSPCELLGGLWVFLSRRCWCLRPSVELVPEPEDSSPVLTWILVYFWSPLMGVSPCVEWGHARALSFRTVAAWSRFPSRETRDLWISLEAFPRGFTMKLSHRAVPRAMV